MSRTNGLALFRTLVRTFRDCHNSNPLQCFARIERGQGADLGKGTFVRGLSF